MIEEEDILESLYKTHLEDIEMPVSDSLWNRIRKTIALNRLRKILGALALIGAVIGLSLFFIHPADLNRNSYAKENKTRISWKNKPNGNDQEEIRDTYQKKTLTVTKKNKTDSLWDNITYIDKKDIKNVDQKKKILKNVNTEINNSKKITEIGLPSSQQSKLPGKRSLHPLIVDKGQKKSNQKTEIDIKQKKSLPTTQNENSQTEKNTKNKEDSIANPLNKEILSNGNSPKSAENNTPLTDSIPKLKDGNPITGQNQVLKTDSNPTTSQNQVLKTDTFPTQPSDSAGMNSSNSQKPDSTLSGNTPPPKDNENKLKLFINAESGGLIPIVSSSIAGITMTNNPTGNKVQNLSYDERVELGFMIQNKLSLNIGLGLSHFQGNYSQTVSNAIQWKDTTGKNHTTTVVINSKAGFDCQFLNIPVFAEYLFGLSPKWNLAPSIGVILNYLLNAQSTASASSSQSIPGVSLTNATSTNRTTDFKPLTASTLTGLRLEYILNEKWKIYLCPSYSFFIGDLVKEGNILKITPSAFNANLGITYFFR